MLTLSLDGAPRRKNIQQWVGGNIAEELLGQLLRLNDRMHAALSSWHAATTEFAEACSRSQVLDARSHLANVLQVLAHQPQSCRMPMESYFRAQAC